MTTTPNLPVPAGATADDWCDQTDTDGADMARALTSSRHDTDIDVYVRGAKHHDGSVSRDIVVRELNADAPMTIKQARQLARALAELVAEAEQMDGHDKTVISSSGPARVGPSPRFGVARRPNTNPVVLPSTA